MIAVQKSQKVGPAIPHHTRVLMGERARVSASNYLAKPQIKNLKAPMFNDQNAFGTTANHPKSTRANPKSTVDLGLAHLIRVENAPPTPLSPVHRHAFSSITMRHLTRTNKNRTAAHQKIYLAAGRFRLRDFLHRLRFKKMRSLILSMQNATLSMFNCS